MIAHKNCRTLKHHWRPPKDPLKIYPRDDHQLYLNTVIKMNKNQKGQY